MCAVREAAASQATERRRRSRAKKGKIIQAKVGQEMWRQKTPGLLGWYLRDKLILQKAAWGNS
jgi:hypothetical protein